MKAAKPAKAAAKADKKQDVAEVRRGVHAHESNMHPGKAKTKIK